MATGAVPGAATPAFTLRLDIPAILEHAARYCLWAALFCATLNGGWLVRTPRGAGAPLHLYWFDPAVVAVLALWGARLVVAPAAPLTVGPRLPAIALGGLVGLALLGVPFAADSAVALGMAGRFWLLGLLYLYIVNCRPSTVLTASALLCSLTVQALVALGQTIRQSSLGLAPFGEPRLDPLRPGVAVTVVGGVRRLRAYGLTDHPNILGGFAAVGGIVLVAGLPARFRPLGGLVVVTVLLGTLSRGAWLACGLGAMIVWWGGRHERQRDGNQIHGSMAKAWRMVVGALLVGGVALIGSLRLNFHNSLEIQSIQAHLVEIGQAGGLILHHPILGVGANCYPVALARVVSAATYAPYGVPVVHNIFLLSAAELGVAAPLLLGVLLLVPCLSLGRQDSTASMRGYAAALAACAVLGLTDFSEWASPGFRLLWVAVVALWAAEASAKFDLDHTTV
jgi:hypothetical protein